MLGSGWILIVALACSGVPAQAGGRESKCYVLTDLESPGGESAGGQLVLCVTSANLERFPRSVVTFTVKQPGGRRLPASDGRGHVIARRHFLAMGDGEYGHPGRSSKPQVIFDEDRHTVYLGFLGARNGVGRTYRYEASK